MSVFSLFQIVDEAKKLGSYSIANLAFSVLLEKALYDDEIEGRLHFLWEKSQGNDDDDIYYDLLVVSDGLRDACIPAPLLKKPEFFRPLCKEEVEKLDHNRGIDPSILEVKDIKKELNALVEKIKAISPDYMKIAQKYLSEWEISLDSSGFHEKVEVAKHLVFATVENTGKLRRIFMPEKGMKFDEIPWESSSDYTLSGSLNDANLSVVKSDGDPQWIWYFVSRRLRTLTNGESRWLIGKGCDASSYYEVWIIKDPSAKISINKDKYPDPDSLWWPLVCQDDLAYNYVEAVIASWGRRPRNVVPFKNICDTADILQHLPVLKKNHNKKDPYYTDRWLVWNRKLNRFDVLANLKGS